MITFETVKKDLQEIAEFGSSEIQRFPNSRDLADRSTILVLEPIETHVRNHLVHASYVLSFMSKSEKRAEKNSLKFVERFYSSDLESKGYRIGSVIYKPIAQPFTPRYQVEIQTISTI